MAPTIIRRDLAEPLPEPGKIATLAALVVLGGSQGVADITDRSGLRAEYIFVQRALASDLPTLGICLGSQLMAKALGSTSWTGDWELGWHSVSGPQNTMNSIQLPEEFSALHWHRDRFSTPPGASSLAHTVTTPCQAFAKGPHLGLLFHLEADSDQMTAMAEHLPTDLAESRMSLDQLLQDSHTFAQATARLADSVFGQWADHAIADTNPNSTAGFAS
jgi:GMP synthase (glutamine-hydrolysing)